MSFLGKIADAFVQTDDDPKDGKNPVAPQAPVQNNTSAIPFMSQVPTTTLGMSNNVSATNVDNNIKPINVSEMQEKLLSLLKNGKQAGITYDFRDFIDGVNGMEGMISDPNTRIQAVLKSIGNLVSPSTLIQSADYYLNFLESQKQNIENSMAQAVKVNITDKEQRVEDIDNSIQKMQADIEKLETEKNALKIQVATSKVQIESDKNTFAIAYQKVQQDFTNYKTKLLGFQQQHN